MTEKLCSLFSEIDASLQIGLQTINPEALKYINRKLDREVFLDRCRMMSDYGLSFGIDLIYGLPGDSYSGFRDSLDFAVSASPNNIDIFPLSVLPGTELSDKSAELGLKHTGFPVYRVKENPTFTKTDIRKAETLTEACDGLYNIEQSFAWFNTAASTLGKSPSEVFDSYRTGGIKDPLKFISREFKLQNKNEYAQVMESFIRWSKAAEKAFQNPGAKINVSLCRKPEILDELAGLSMDKFLRRHPSGKNKSYSLYFDGQELFIS